MPYTPPSQRSPANSKPNSPVLTRAHSYTDTTHRYHGAASPQHGHRPALPHSLNSTSYLSKHRRSPSISDAPTTGGTRAGSSDHSGSKTNGSLRQSPSPVSNTLMPTGAITTPPDSSQNSSDEEDRGRGRESLTGDLAQLAQALQKIELKRDPSPEGAKTGSLPLPPALRRTHSSGSPALTPEARKIAHSRSNSELTLSTHNTQLADSPLQSSDDSDDEDDELIVKPPLLRKKSGELVKPALRPSSRRRPSSMPGTPTFSKSVHFGENIEQVRHFLQVERPIAVSANSSPVDNYDSESEYPFGGSDDQYRSRSVEWDIKLTNFPSDTMERLALPVRVERIFLSADHKTLIGSVAVANLAFQKLVVARFTLDYWKTTSEVVAEFNNDVRKKQSQDGCDRFNFNIKLTDQANLESKTMLLCVRYNVNGQEYWDNNNMMNYQVDFIKKQRTKHAKPSPPTTTPAQGVGSLGTIPRSRHTHSTSPSGRPRTAPSSFDDDFANGFDAKYRFGSNGRLVGESLNNPIRFKKPSRQASFHPDQPQQPGQAFSTRYDFGASLTAALNTAQTAVQTKIPSSSKAKSSHSLPKSSASAPATPMGPNPSTIASDKPDLKSAEYNELIQKYCFFGSGKSSPQSSTSPNAPPKPTPVNESAAVASGNDSDTTPPGSNNSSGSNTPNSPNGLSPALDGTADQRSATTKIIPRPRSVSPGPVTGSDFSTRTASPVSFGYPYHQNTGGIFPKSNTPTAIRG